MLKTMKNIFNNNWFIVFILIILIGFDIFIHIPIIDIESNYFAAIMGFVGILTAFIVIGNYAQVKDTENKFRDKTKDLEQIIDSVSKDLHTKQYELYADLYLAKGDVQIIPFKNPLIAYGEIDYSPVGNAMINYLRSITFSLEIPDTMRVEKPIDSLLDTDKNFKPTAYSTITQPSATEIIKAIKRHANYLYIANEFTYMLKILNTAPEPQKQEPVNADQ